MLVLSRKLQQSIVIGEGNDKIVITVTAIRGGNVRLGIKAPRQIPVFREELSDLPPKKASDAPVDR